MVVINIKSDEEFKKTIEMDKVTVALFSADWVEQCKQVEDVFELLDTKGYVKLQFAKILAEDLSEISIKHQVDAVPTVIFFEKGVAIDRVDGVDVAAINTKCIKFASSSTSSLEDRLKGLINKAKVMIFIKGTRDIPKCGFSKTLISMINGLGIQYETFDILSDEEVRQGLKIYSEWPTYPQVYVNGELIGGLDIIKELENNGELLSTLQG